MTPSLDVRLFHAYRSGFRLQLEFVHPIDGFQLTALVGASGSGKTSVLRALAGLDRPDAGTIRFGDLEWFDSSKKICVTPQQRGVGCLFQDYALFPHLTVAQNVRFGLRGRTEVECRERVSSLLSMLQLHNVESRLPQELSGGQQQRVALARAVAPRPKLLLLDEPLSALDTPTRRELRGLVRQFVESQGIPTIIVTHDPWDVRELADRVVVLDGGEVQQAGTTSEVLRNPCSVRVAQLLAVDESLPRSLNPLTAGIGAHEV